jgi:hypothetical protein
VAITEKTRQADDRLREELRNADIGKLKKLMAPLIEKDEKSLSAKHRKSSLRKRNR